jgi:hypothetical protein
MPPPQKIVVLIQIRYVASLKSQDVSRPLARRPAECRDPPQLDATLGPLRDLEDRGLGKPPHQASWPARSQTRRARRRPDEANADPTAPASRPTPVRRNAPDKADDGPRTPARWRWPVRRRWPARWRWPVRRRWPSYQVPRLTRRRRGGPARWRAGRRSTRHRGARRRSRADARLASSPRPARRDGAPQAPRCRDR